MDICVIVYTGEASSQNAKFSNTSNGASFQSHYPTLPSITPRTPRPDQDGKPTPPMVMKTSPTPMSSARHPPVNHVNQNGSQIRHDYPLSNREFSDSQTSDKYDNSQSTNNIPAAQAQPNNNYTYNNSYNGTNNNQGTKPPNDLRVNSDNYNTGSSNNNSYQVTKPPNDLRVGSHPLSNSDNHTDPSQHHLAGSPRRHPGPGDNGQDDFLRPLSATPPLVLNEKSKSVKAIQQGSNEHKHDEDSGIAGFTPDTYRDNEPLDR